MVNKALAFVLGLTIGAYTLSSWSCKKPPLIPDNNPPSVSQVQITPNNPIKGQDLNLSYNYSDADGDDDKSMKEWYRNGAITGVTGTTFPSDSAEANDKVKAKVMPYDGEDFGNEEFSNEVSYERYNSAPSVSNVDIGPDDATLEDMIQLSYDYTDPQNDPDHSIIEWYNNTPIQTGGTTLAANKTSIGDVIKAVVKPYDGELEGTEKTSDSIIIQGLSYRTISGQIKKHCSQTPDEGVRIITSMGETFTDANGNYSVEASTDREDVLVLKEGRLESGIIVEAGQNDIERNHTISNDTKENGIDRWLLKNYVLYSKLHYGSDLGRSPGPEDGQYVALTEESVPDTAWILGKTTLSNGAIYAVGFQTLEQINLLGKKINEDLAEATNNLFNINETVIAIADSNYIGAQFDYPNMVAVQNTQFNINNLDYARQSFFIAASATGVGFNGANYEDDNVTIKGGGVIINHDANLNTSGIFNTEAYAIILGDVETPDGYESVLAGGGRTIYPHDTRITNWTIMRGPGHQYPDFPKDFNPDLTDKYNDN